MNARNVRSGVAWIPRERTHHKGEWPSELQEPDQERFKSLEDGEVATARGTDGSTFVAIGRRETGRHGYQWVALPGEASRMVSPFLLHMFTVLAVIALLITSLIGWKETTGAVSEISRGIDALGTRLPSESEKLLLERFSGLEKEIKASRNEALSAINEQKEHILSLKTRVESKLVDFSKQQDGAERTPGKKGGGKRSDSSNSGGQLAMPEPSGESQSWEEEKAVPSVD